jgi:hypothetical protein
VLFPSFVDTAAAFLAEACGEIHNRAGKQRGGESVLIVHGNVQQRYQWQMAIQGK